jgi:hypothetical protein
LTDREGFAGATGLFRLHPDGLAQHGLAVLEVADRSIREIDPTPTRFVDEVADDPFLGSGSPFDDNPFRQRDPVEPALGNEPPLIQ